VSTKLAYAGSTVDLQKLNTCNLQGVVTITPKKSVDIYTDGACSGNPGPGGWAALLIYGEHEKEIAGGAKDTTSQRMELTAAIEGLSALKYPCRVRLYTDSAYLVNAFRRKWVRKWQQNGWLTTNKERVRNKDLWMKLLSLSNKHHIEWIKVKGHAGNELNNRCDRLAREYIPIC